MTERSYLWDGSIHDGGVGDAGPYDEIMWRDIIKALLGTTSLENAGVIPGSGAEGSNGLYVVPTNPASRNIRVETGMAVVNGQIYHNDSNITLTISENNTANPRVDLIGLRWNGTAKTVRVFKREGSPASNPSAPALTSTANVKEIPLAHVSAESSFASIDTSDIRYVAEYIQNGSIQVNAYNNNSGSTILAGRAVKISADHDHSIVHTTDEESFIGITVGDIYNTNYGLVCTGGIIKAYLLSGISRGNYAVLSNFSGILRGVASPTSWAVGRILESGTSAGYYDILIDRHRANIDGLSVELIDIVADSPFTLEAGVDGLITYTVTNNDDNNIRGAYLVHVATGNRIFSVAPNFESSISNTILSKNMAGGEYRAVINHQASLSAYGLFFNSPDE